jgi:wyosine [tRNA(Phe)-imidazoG37] synthetase (radical SAM superfamily)
MKYLFGPVNSRRLGLSLGVDLVPAKICSFDCVYCEVGRTTSLTCREEFVPTDEVIAELDEYFTTPEGGRAGQAPDVVTLTGSGEPTLHSGIGRIIAFLKERTELPVVVLTNGSLLGDPQVRLDLMAADIVVPSLDAARKESYARVNRPARDCGDPQGLIEGLAAFSEEFGGETWLEILLVAGLNDSEADVEALAAAVARIRPSRVQLNTVVRPPAESWARPLTADRMREIASRFGTVPVEVIADFTGKQARAGKVNREEILEILRRRPGTIEDISQASGLAEPVVARLISELAKAGGIRETIHDGRKYYQINKS